MKLRRHVALFYCFIRGTYLALVTPSAAVDLPHGCRDTAASFVSHLSTTASSDGVITVAAAAAAAAHYIGGAGLSDAGVYLYLLHKKDLSFLLFPSAAVVFRCLKVAATAAAVQQVTSLPLLSAGLSAGDQRTSKATPPTSGEDLLTKLVRQMPSIEIPTFSAVLSNGVDRIASAIFSHFFPDAQLPHGTLPPGTYVPLQKGASLGRKSPSVEFGRTETCSAEGAADSIRVSGKGGAQGETAEKVTKQISAPVPVPPTASATKPGAAAPVQAPQVPSQSVPPASCSPSNRDRRSFVPLLSNHQEITKSLSLDGKLSSGAASHDSSSAILSSFSEPRFCVNHTSSTSSPRSSGAAQTQQVCTITTGQPGTCTPVTAAEFRGLMSSTSEAAEAATREASSDASKPAGAAAGAASGTTVKGSQAQVVEGGGGALLASLLLSTARSASSKAEEAGNLSPAVASAGASGQQQPGVLSPGEESTFEGVELRGNVFEKLQNAETSPFVDLSATLGFLSSVEVSDPLLLALIGFHLLLVAAVFSCRRVHAAQLLLMCFVSLLLLCSKQLLLLCSLVEQRLRTDNSLASAVAAFSSPVLPSSPSTSSSLSPAAPQFYCSPSAAARATSFLLLFWWLPLFTVLVLLVGTLLHELVASLRLLAMRKAKATKRRLRSGEETVASASSALRPRSSEAARQQPN